MKFKETVSNVKDQDMIYLVECETLAPSKKRRRGQSLEPDYITTTGGGICISADGLILTVAHVIPADDSKIIVRSRNGNFLSATIFNMCRNLDICLLLVKPKENQKFSYYNMRNDKQTSVEEADKIFVFGHQMSIPFSLFSGIVSYQHVEVVHPRPPYTPFESHTKFVDDFKKSPTFRTLGGVIDVDMIDTTIAVLDSRMPVIETTGLLLSEGSSGCPVFKKEDGSLIGLVILQVGVRNFILPMSMVVEYISTTFKSIKGLMREVRTELECGGTETKVKEEGNTKKRTYHQGGSSRKSQETTKRRKHEMAINDAAKDWGLKCLYYEIKDISPPCGVKAAMEMQAEAERNKRAPVLESEGERQAHINIADGKKISVILASEAAKMDQVNRAQGEAEAIIAVAQATTLKSKNHGGVEDISPPCGVKAAMEMEAEAERKKRAPVLESEGERQAHINIADGKKSSVILASEAAKMDQVNRAQGELPIWYSN